MVIPDSFEYTFSLEKLANFEGTRSALTFPVATKSAPLVAQQNTID
jgi:hypothetical protein